MKECSGEIGEFAKLLDCNSICEKNKKEAADKGCESEYDEVASCESDLNVCNPDESKCKTENEKLASCMSK